ncbi:MAG: DUF5690 family protein [Bacteroidota bacterium]
MPWSRSDRTTALYAALTAFGTYVFVFGFRKSFTVCTFEGLTLGPMAYKTALVITQMLGYLAAKFYGIRYISSLKRVGRHKVIFLLTGISWLAWLLFALIPAPINFIFLFMNGFPLGMLWGVVFSYVEGRKSTDLIGAALAVSFIFSSGWVKSVGAWLMKEFSVPEFWIPFSVGAVFVIPLIAFVYAMEKIPAPTPEDEWLRQPRQPMTAVQRRTVLRTFLPGILAFTSIYLFATIFRDIRDNFSADMWKEMGFSVRPAVFSQTEIPIMLIVLVVIGAVVLVRYSYRALQIAHLFILFGFIIGGVCSWLFMQKQLTPFYWMIGSGLGLYLVYIPFNSIYFDRLIASFSMKANTGFFIYWVDAIGYVGSVAVLLIKENLSFEISWTDFFAKAMIVLSLLGSGLTLLAFLYFSRLHKKNASPAA